MPEQDPQFSLETQLRAIRDLLNQLQMGDHDFDENVRMFREGTEMIKACREYLDEAEMSIKALVDGEEQEVG
ncbi:MAG: exodeoxyribonuclease VII small subunit [Bacteroidota bacterium]